MREQMYTIPLMDAYQSGDECPFCFIERNLEQHAIHFVLGPGASYMEDDIREATDKTGFCRHHYKMMYDYGNRLGSALILSTHLKKFNQELAKEIKEFTPGKANFFKRMKATSAGKEEPKTALGGWINQKTHTCYVCDHFNQNYYRYLNNFFSVYRKNAEFREVFANSKGFCLPHFGDLIETAEDKLNDAEKKEFYPLIFKMMQDNLERLQKEVSWFVDKNDYLNKDKPWGTSQDSIERAMQKCCGGYPADPVFKQKP